MKDYTIPSCIDYTQRNYNLKEKKMIIPKIIVNDYGWEFVTGMKFIPEKKDVGVSDGMFKSGVENITGSY